MHHHGAGEEWVVGPLRETATVLGSSGRWIAYVLPCRCIDPHIDGGDPVGGCDHDTDCSLGAMHLAPRVCAYR